MRFIPHACHRSRKTELPGDTGDAETPPGLLDRRARRASGTAGSVLMGVDISGLWLWGDERWGHWPPDGTLYLLGLCLWGMSPGLGQSLGPWATPDLVEFCRSWHPGGQLVWMESTW